MKPYIAKQRSKPRHEEHNLQTSCVNWFRYQYPTFSKMLIAVPNGGRRDAITGAMLKAEGVLAGVADLILLIPNRCYHSLLIELKTKSGTQSKAQKEWQQEVERLGYSKYILVRSIDEFIDEINDYLKQ